MNNTMPRTPFSTPLSGSAREAEMRLKNIFSGPKKRPPIPFLALVFSLCIFCGDLVSCNVSEAEPSRPNIAVDWDHLAPPDLTLAHVDWDSVTELDPVCIPEDSGDVLIQNLEDVYVEWRRSAAGNFLYFAGDPAFCCPSLAGRTAEGSAKWRDEPDAWGPVAVDIAVNDDRLEDGTVEGYSLHFAAGWGEQEVLESDFSSDVGDGALELSEKELLHAAWVLSKLMIEAEWAATAEVTIFPQRPDLDRDGVPEEIRMYDSTPFGRGQRLEIWEDGKRVYQAEGDHAHVGWNAVFLCTLDGEDYLLRYDPYMGQGFAGYNYALFTLEGGAEKVVRENELYFEVNFGMPTPDGGMVDPEEIFDPDKIADFMEEINELLSHSVQLLNTDQDLLRAFEREGRLVDTLDFMYTEVFTPDPRKPLRENLRDYRDTMVRAIGSSRMDSN